MVLPSRKDYPDYYQVIMEPIDLTIIETKLKTDKVSRKVPCFFFLKKIIF